MYVYGVSFSGNENVLKSVMMVHISVNIVKNIKLYTLKWGSYMVCELYFRKALKLFPRKGGLDSSSKDIM